MLYDTTYRHNQALSPSGLETLPAALHALNAAVDDCRRAGKPATRDAAVLLLIRHLAAVADRDTGTPADLRLACVAELADVLAAPALLDIAGHSVAGDDAAKRAFHADARRALINLGRALGLDEGSIRVRSDLGSADEDGTTELRHPDLGIRVRPRGFLPDSEISFNRCRRGEPASRNHLAPIAELLDSKAFACRLAATIGPVSASLPAAA